MIGNGVPKQHCGLPHEHVNHTQGGTPEAPHFWCDGVPVLGPFIELVVRVPLVGTLDMGDVTHAEALEEILEEGLGTYVWDEMFPPNATALASMRLRCGGEDRVYPLRMENGAWVTP